MTSCPWGLFGGRDAGPSRLLVKRAGASRFVTFSEAFGTVSDSRVANIMLTRGDQVMLCSPGGGGYGPPNEREPKLVLRDVDDGFISADAAAGAYSVAIDRENGGFVINSEKTAALRQ